MLFLTRAGDILYSKASRPSPGTTQPPIQSTPLAVSLDVMRLGHEADYSYHLVPRLRISGAVPPLPHKPSWRAQELPYFTIRPSCVARLDLHKARSLFKHDYCLGLRSSVKRTVSEDRPTSVSIIRYKVYTELGPSERVSFKNWTSRVLGNSMTVFTYHICCNTPSSDIFRRIQELQMLTM